MEILIGLGLGIFITSIIVALILNKETDVEEKTEHQELLDANKHIGSLEDRVLDYVKKIHELEHSLDEVNEKFATLQNQKISADVKLGQKSEVLLPFLADFPYKDDEIHGMYKPVDLVVFRPNEVVFVEVKSGQSQLSAKQKQIRDNIQAGRVRFEIHRMNEKGVSIK